MELLARLCREFLRTGKATDRSTETYRLTLGRCSVTCSYYLVSSTFVCPNYSVETNLTIGSQHFLSVGMLVTHEILVLSTVAAYVYLRNHLRDTRVGRSLFVCLFICLFVC